MAAIRCRPRSHAVDGQTLLAWNCPWGLILNITGTIAPFEGMVIAGGNTLEALAGAWVLTSLAGFRLSLERLRDVLALVVWGAIASTTVSATVGVVVLALSGGAGGVSYWTIWTTWFSGDAIGILLITPLILTWAVGPPIRVSWRDVIEASVLATLLIASAAALWQARVSYVYAIFPLTIWAALRFGPPWRSDRSFCRIRDRCRVHCRRASGPSRTPRLGTTSSYSRPSSVSSRSPT